MDETSHDLKLDKLYETYDTDWLDSSTIPSISMKYLKPRADSLRASFQRLRSAFQILPIVGLSSEIRGVVKLLTEMAAELDSTKLRTTEAPELVGKMQDAFLTRCQSRKTLEDYHPEFLRLCRSISADSSLPTSRDALIALLYNQIVASWTLYEVLATDVWVDVVNNNPRTLGRNAWQFSGKTTSDASMDEPDKEIDIDA